MIEAGKRLQDPHLLRRAEWMGNWELNIQRTDGASHGGNISEQEGAAVFDTGQIMRGYFALYKETGNMRYRDAARRAGSWLIAQEKNKEGLWQINNARSVDQVMTTYMTYALAPVAQWGKELNISEWTEAARRCGNATLREQEKNGWFKNCDFQNGDSPLLHTIAYTIDGLWDLGVLLGEQKFLDGAKRAMSGVLSVMDEKGHIPGRLDHEWHSSVEWSCLTGVAQIGVTAMKMFHATKEQKYKEKAILAKDFLKSCQNNTESEWGGGIGAMWGSWPINGGYASAQSINWAAKYFADLLLAIDASDSTLPHELA
jgi:uncharacterized protein YyaL (SSP411 family)